MRARSITQRKQFKAFYAATPELARAAIAQKTLARANESQQSIRLLIGFVAGLLFFAATESVLGTASWHSLARTLLSFAVGLGVSGLLISRLRQSAPACPVCKHDWTIKSGSSVPIQDMMEGWDSCPGCGLLMADWALQRAARQKGDTGPRN